MNALTTQSPAPRIALFSGNYNYLRDGANQALNRWVEYLERHGVAVRVYSPTSEVPAFSPAGTLISVPSIAIPGRNEYRLALGLPRSVRRDLEDFQPNIFHLSAPDLLGYSALQLAKKWQLPAVASVHTRFETYLKYYGLGWLENTMVRYLRHFYSSCVEIYAPTESTARTLAAQRMSDSVRIWGRGVDSDRFSPAKRSDAWRAAHGFGVNDVVVTFVGRLVLEKGLDLFAQSVSRARQRGLAFKILIVGDGPERDRFRKRLPDAVFAGFLEGDDLARAYASSDIFFNPSTTEGIGNVTLEAMASGLAPICANATGSVSLVSHGVTGLVSNQCCPDDFVDHLFHLVARADVRRAMGQAARTASLTYVWDNVLRGLLSQIQGVLSKHNTYSTAESSAPAASLQL